MTKHEAIVLSAYTGILLTKDFSDVHKFCESLLGRPIFSHEFADQGIWDEVHEKCKPFVGGIIENEADDPMFINYVIGDATRPIGEGTKIIAHVCNNKGGWGAGFVLALSKKWSEPETCYRSAALSNDLLLGKTMFVNVENGIVIANMIAQNGYKSAENPCPLDYTALGICLDDVRNFADEIGASVHMPRIGCGLAGGKWNEIELIIKSNLCAFGVPVYVYDLK
ncbi:MAG: hypothetical protein KH231_05975 [Dialister sp.]|uniref:DUF7736 domain-containing protein n=1 Tax=Dialister sp. TaxID=1955814 RepID=UPI001D95B5D6|nr:hypothetical protein [Dialister sp.]MBS6715004.1 hypothetical protein [Dialister sp.]